jgi:MarR family transcriptional regulator, temperature-dependent positive regulator of motility
MIASMVKLRVKVPHHVPAHLARRFHQICLGLTAEVTEQAGLTPVEYAVLASLETVPDIEQAALARRLGIDPVSAHHMVNRLTAAGYVERRVSAVDRRARALRLTQRGQALRDRLRKGAVAAQDRILSPLPASDRAKFLEMLTKLVEDHETYARPGNGRRRAPRAVAEVEARRPA